jgi:hypothetical protein
MSTGRLKPVPQQTSPPMQSACVTQTTNPLLFPQLLLDASQTALTPGKEPARQQTSLPPQSSGPSQSKELLRKPPVQELPSLWQAPAPLVRQQNSLALQTVLPSLEQTTPSSAVPL